MAKPKILVVGSFVMDQIATTEVFPREGQTVLGEPSLRRREGKAPIRRCRWHGWGQT